MLKPLLLPALLFIALTSTAQSWNWARGFGSVSPDYIRAMAVDEQGYIYVTGSYSNSLVIGADTLPYIGSNEIFIAKLDSTGSPVWTRGYAGTAFDQANGIALDGYGNSYITGYFSTQVIIGPDTLAGNGVFVAKHDAAGNALWAKDLGSGTGYDITATNAGGFYLTGECSYCLFDTLVFDYLGSSDAFLAKMDTAGQFAWAARPAGGSF